MPSVLVRVHRLAFGHCVHYWTHNSVMIDDFEADYLFKSSRPQGGTVKSTARQAAGQTVLERLVDQRHLHYITSKEGRRKDKWNTNKSLVSAVLFSDGAHCSTVNNTNTQN